MTVLDDIAADKQRITDRLARVDAERDRLTQQLAELDAAERVLSHGLRRFAARQAWAEGCSSGSSPNRAVVAQPTNAAGGDHRDGTSTESRSRARRSQNTTEARCAARQRHAPGRRSAWQQRVC